jgi:tRNA/tmRNA/rRNA uracil-C5-methylase (TrmA/RlmC/RlmD family)
VFGPDRAALLAATQPGDAGQAARRDKQATTLRTELRRIDTAQASLIRELETDPGSAGPAVSAYRARIRARFTELEHERTQAAAQLDTLTTTAQPTQDPGLLDALPLLPGLIEEIPAKLLAGLLEAFDIQAIYHKKDHQVTIRAVLTHNTPQAIADLLASLTPEHHPAPTPEPASTPTQTSDFYPSPDHKRRCSLPQPSPTGPRLQSIAMR